MPKSEALNPRVINFFSYLLWSFPITNVLALGAFYNLPLPKMAAILFSVFYIVHAAIAIGTGFALYHMKPYAWHLFVFHCLLMVVEQFYVALTMAENYHVEIPLTFACIVIVACLFLLTLELRVPYFNPRIAWWESDPRYKISVPAQMTAADHFYHGEIMDISAGGCFIKLKETLKTEQLIQVKFALFDQKFDCSGKIVWRTDSGVTHPKGVGVKFYGLEKKNQIALRETVKKLKSLSKKYRRLRKEERASTMEQKVESLLSQRKG
jgi:Tfp pilus assembly protein PilZ